MEDDDDDLYDPADAVPTTQHHPAQNPQSNAPTQGTDEGEEEEIEVEEDDVRPRFHRREHNANRPRTISISSPKRHPTRLYQKCKTKHPPPTATSNTTQSSSAPCGPPNRVPAPIIRRLPDLQIRDPLSNPQSRNRNARPSQRTASRAPKTGLLIPPGARVHHRRERQPRPPSDRETDHVDRPRRRLPR